MNLILKNKITSPCLLNYFINSHFFFHFNVFCYLRSKTNNILIKLFFLGLCRKDKDGQGIIPADKPKPVYQAASPKSRTHGTSGRRCCRRPLRPRKAPQRWRPRRGRRPRWCRRRDRTVRGSLASGMWDMIALRNKIRYDSFWNNIYFVSFFLGLTWRITSTNDCNLTDNTAYLERGKNTLKKGNIN